MIETKTSDIDENSSEFQNYLIKKGEELAKLLKDHDYNGLMRRVRKSDTLLYMAVSFYKWKDAENKHVGLLKETNNIDIRKCPACEQDWPHPSVTSELKCPRCKEFALRVALQEAISIIDICDGLSPCGYHYGEQKWYHGEKCGVLVAERLRKILYD